jgi:hypothetical protein
MFLNEHFTLQFEIHKNILLKEFELMYKIVVLNFKEQFHRLLQKMPKHT